METLHVLDRLCWCLSVYLICPPALKVEGITKTTAKNASNLSDGVGVLVYVLGLLLLLLGHGHVHPTPQSPLPMLGDLRMFPL